MSSYSSTATELYVLFCATNIYVLKTVNEIVWEPYMDEPFHAGQAQAYCRNEWTSWDPKITTPPGLYIISVILKQFFVFRCTLPILRLTPLLFLISLPVLLHRLQRYHNLERPPLNFFSTSVESIVLAMFPIAWFFGFLYYTDVPSVAFVIATVTAAGRGNHWIAGLLGLMSCTFRQTNIIWLFYAFAHSQLTSFYLRSRSSVKPEGHENASLYDPMALKAEISDLPRIVSSVPAVLPSILKDSLPYIINLVLMSAFIVWNGGIVLGDKSNHIPSLHIPQFYYFVAFSTIFGWPALISDPEYGAVGLVKDVWYRMFGNKRNVIITAVLTSLIMISIYFYTLDHPFLLSDNRHYTFYVWKRIFRFHPLIPYLLAPGYLACMWAWFIRLGRHQTILQTLVLPLSSLLTLLPTPLLEPRYFLIPYILARSQLADVPMWAVVLEGVWYGAINTITMYVFLYKEREGVGRFIW